MGTYFCQRFHNEGVPPTEKYLAAFIAAAEQNKRLSCATWSA